MTIIFMQTCLAAAYYVIFLSFDNPLTPEGIDDSVLNPMPTPTESVMAMFLMSVNTFTDYYTAFDKTSHTLVAKVLSLYTRTEQKYTCVTHTHTSDRILNSFLNTMFIVFSIKTTRLNKIYFGNMFLGRSSFLKFLGHKVQNEFD